MTREASSDAATMVWRIALQIRNNLDVQGSHRRAFPGTQDLSHAHGSEPITSANVAEVPSQYKVKLDEFPLQVRPVMLRERWNLRRETDPVRVDCLTQIRMFLFSRS
jgi:hypothetical protein